MIYPIHQETIIKRKSVAKYPNSTQPNIALTRKQQKTHTLKSLLSNSQNTEPYTCDKGFLYYLIASQIRKKDRPIGQIQTQFSGMS